MQRLCAAFTARGKQFAAQSAAINPRIHRKRDSMDIEWSRMHAVVSAPLRWKRTRRIFIAEDNIAVSGDNFVGGVDWEAQSGEK
jgi:hypothetical protein